MAERAGNSDDVYFSVPGVATVRWDHSTSTVIVVWDGWANTSEFKSLLDAEVKALLDNGGTRLLADCRRQRVLNLADQDRANKEWLPDVVAAGLERFAIVLPESEIAAGHLRERLGTVTDMEVAYFGTVEEAWDWLRS
ncbi:MAG TPA: STAS/SEC14 domain-containing protein [Candidatus Dormibacteraeota bacterium]|nr:STAS/SEC14 domain-containing protein [Candidatus Dormibacteraeota bacterium]